MAKRQRSLQKKRERLNKTRNKKKGINAEETRGVLYDGLEDILSLGEGDSMYKANFFPTETEKDDIFLNILNEAFFEQMFFFSHGNNEDEEVKPIPRLITAQTYKSDEASPIYRMPGCNERNIGTTKWTPTVAKVRDAVSEHYGQRFNHCVITLYRNGQDTLGSHKDKLLDLQHNSLILSVSFGAPRPIWFKGSEDSENHTVMLQSGSVLSIGPKTNLNYTHGIPRVEGLDAPRISLSFRTIATKINEKTNEIIGKGNKYQTKNYPFIRSYPNRKSYTKEVLKIVESHEEKARLELIKIREKVAEAIKEKREVAVPAA